MQHITYVALSYIYATLSHIFKAPNRGKFVAFSIPINEMERTTT